MPDAPAADDDPHHAGLVFLRVPADPRYARVVRIAVSAFAVRLGLPAASVEDLRLGVDEALVLLLGAGGSGSGDPDDGGDPEDGDRHVVVSLEAEDERLPVLLRLQLDPEPASVADDPGALARFRELVPPAVLVDAVDREAGRVELRLPG